ncbi:MAG: response regulator [Gammaproteobacteria bacterium]|nr:response regulator [Gammaproteobacteria bacterium]
MSFFKKILVVDEAESSRRFLRHVLTNAGYTVEAVASNGQAIERINEGHIDIFFVDVSLPEMEGIKLIKTLRESDEYAAAPILVVTLAMKISDEMIQQCGAAKITEWIPKPISPSKVLSLLKKMNYESNNTLYAQSAF